MAKGGGKIQKKILLLLYAGLSLTLAAGSPRGQLRVLKMLGKEWGRINRDTLRLAIKSLYRSKLVDFSELGGGRVKMVLSRSGKEKVLEYDIDNLRIRNPGQWDGKWRIVVFDIPKDKKKIREAFRFHIKRLGFYQLQKSVFVYPHRCNNEVEFLIEFYEARPYVRQILASDIDNSLHLKDIFNL